MPSSLHPPTCHHPFAAGGVLPGARRRGVQHGDAPQGRVPAHQLRGWNHQGLGVSLEAGGRSWTTTLPTRQPTPSGTAAVSMYIIPAAAALPVLWHLQQFSVPSLEHLTIPPTILACPIGCCSIHAFTASSLHCELHARVVIPPTTITSRRGRLCDAQCAVAWPVSPLALPAAVCGHVAACAALAGQLPFAGAPQACAAQVGTGTSGYGTQWHACW